MDRKEIFEDFARGDDSPPASVRPIMAGWWRIGLDPGDDPSIAKAVLTNRDERFDFVLRQSLRACSTDRLWLMWRALHLRVDRRER